MPSKINAYQVITDRIIQLLEQGTIPWQKPWTGSDEAMSLVTKKTYRGINRFLLNISGYACPYWATIRQINKLGGKVNKGEKSTPIVFWKWLEKENAETGETYEVPLLRYYRVFNIEQTTGIEVPAPEEAVEREFTPIETCELIIRQMTNKPVIQHKAQSAWYRPSQDLINMPRPETFTSDESYFSTLFHELGHCTGHESRLNRPTLNDMAPFGTTNYSKEELVAEMTASMLCGETGILNKTIDNSASYIQGWLSKLRGDSKLVVQAAAQAQKAADYIIGKSAGQKE